jgi:hypothetical protein
MPLLAKRNTEHGSGLGRWRWVVERTFAWLNQFRRLRVRYEKRAWVGAPPTVRAGPALSPFLNSPLDFEFQAKFPAITHVSRRLHRFHCPNSDLNRRN